jgi:hypothetical protein
VMLIAQGSDRLRGANANRYGRNHESRFLFDSMRLNAWQALVLGPPNRTWVEIRIVTLTFASWNRVGEWLRHVEGLRRMASRANIGRTTPYCKQTLRRL